MATCLGLFWCVQRLPRLNDEPYATSDHATEGKHLSTTLSTGVGMRIGGLSEPIKCDPLRLTVTLAPWLPLFDGSAGLVLVHGRLTLTSFNIHSIIIEQADAIGFNKNTHSPSYRVPN